MDDENLSFDELPEKTKNLTIRIYKFISENNPL